ncbi:hypothetical protein DSO57_1008925 [Entomophthora muscae]|uniref:Uncharacterized protein n=1 Tax=Entomophthora muscae TaxID=34485 RepID=A0ACC2T703_9FUNG|nr:hypothetical protein DSO57_1008925 [Entomophthora muscae]
MSLQLFCLSTAALFFNVALPTIFDEQGFSSPSVESRFHTIQHAAEAYPLSQPINLNKTTKWSHNMNPSDSDAFTFTTLHLKYALPKTIPYCVNTLHKATQVQACDVELKRMYLLPKPITPLQTSTCLNTTCITNITLPSIHYSAIDFYDITLPLGALIANQRHFFPFNRTYIISYTSPIPITFSWKPVYLRVLAKRSLKDNQANFTFVHIFSITIGTHLDSIFYPYQEPGAPSLPTNFSYLITS